MKISSKVLPAILTATLITASAVAQTRFCIGGDLDHITAADRAACSTTMQAVRAEASRLHAPDDWHFVVVCGEQGWTQYTAFSSRGAEALNGAAADTDLEEHTTYLRESSLNAPQPHSLQHAVAHEIAAITLKTHDELAIQNQIAVWERGNLTQTALLLR